MFLEGIVGRIGLREEKGTARLFVDAARDSRITSGMPTKPSALVDTRVSYCGGNLDQPCKLLEIDRFRRKEGREIKPLTIREILDEEIPSK